MTAGRTNVGVLSQHWCTPHKYVGAVRECFGGDIALDPCSNAFSIVRARVQYCLPETDGLHASWNFGTIYVNPPYGADRDRGTTIRDWLRRCMLANRDFGSEVLALVPVAVNTQHWKRFVWGFATGAAFLYDTRLKFLVDGVDSGKGAPMACAMIYWGAHYDRFEQVFMPFGATVNLEQLHEKPLGLPASESDTLLRSSMKDVRYRLSI